MTFSIIIPTYNNCEILNRTLFALSQQTFKDFEVIVIDDGSIDNTYKVCDKFKIRYIYQNHNRAGSARNKGIEIAKGDYIMFLGDDQIVKKDYLKKRLKQHKKHKDMAIESPIYPFNEESQLASFQYAFNWKEKTEPCDFVTANISLPKKWLEEDRFDEIFNFAVAEDTEMGARLAKKGLKIHIDRDNPTSHLHPLNIEEYKNRVRLRAKEQLRVAKQHPEMKDYLMLGMHNIPDEIPSLYEYYLELLSYSIINMHERGYNLKVVTIATPFNGKWFVIDKWLETLENLNFDKKKIQIVFFDNSKDKYFNQHLINWVKENEDKYRLICYVYDNTTCFKRKDPKIDKCFDYGIVENVARIYQLIQRYILGEYCLFIEDDETIEPNTLKRLLNGIQPKDIGAIAGISYDRWGSNHPYVWRHKIDYIFGKEDDCKDCEIRSELVYPSNKETEEVTSTSFGCYLIKREVLDKLTFEPVYKEVFGCDINTGIKVMELGYKTLVDWTVLPTHWHEERWKIKRFKGGEVNEMTKPDGYFEAAGWVDESDARILTQEAKKAKVGIVEIGSYLGRSSIVLARASLEGNKVPVWCIDTWLGVFNIDDCYQDFLKNIEKAKVNKIITPIRQTSITAKIFFKYDYDLLFIDGEHYYPFIKADFELWAKPMRKGVILIHDINGTMDVRKFWDEIKFDYDYDEIGNMGILKIGG